MNCLNMFLKSIFQRMPVVTRCTLQKRTKYKFSPKAEDLGLDLRPPKPKPKFENLRLGPKPSAFGRPLVMESLRNHMTHLCNFTQKSQKHFHTNKRQQWNKNKKSSISLVSNTQKERGTCTRATLKPRYLYIISISFLK